MFYVTLFTMVAIYVMLALSLNLTTGLAGLVSLGHAAFFGLGAYAEAILVARYGVPFPVAVLAALAVAGVAGALVGVASLRLRDDFLVIATIGFNFVMVSVFLFAPFFGAAYGISGIELPFGLHDDAGHVVYFAITLVLMLAVVALHEIVRGSWLGAGFLAVRDDERAAMSLSIDVKRFKILSFLLGAAVAGFAGAIYGPYITTLHADDFGFLLSVTLLTMAAIGGMGTLWGPIVGAVLLGTFEQVFAFVQAYNLLLYGALLMLAMRFFPEGLVGVAKRAVASLRRPRGWARGEEVR